MTAVHWEAPHVPNTHWLHLCLASIGHVAAFMAMRYFIKGSQHRPSVLVLLVISLQLFLLSWCLHCRCSECWMSSEAFPDPDGSGPYDLVAANSGSLWSHASLGLTLSPHAHVVLTSWPFHFHQSLPWRGILLSLTAFTFARRAMEYLHMRA